MIDNMEVLGLIPARGGSKSIPRKNILPLGGFPLISYSIAAGLQAQRIDRLIVSTDDPEIAQVSEKYGAEIPFMRPDKYAQDDTPDFPVFLHALQWLEKHAGYQPDIVVQLRPTSPFRSVKQIDRAVKKLVDQPQADSIRTVCRPFQDPYKMWHIKQDGYMEPIMDHEFDEPYNMPRQELPEVFWQTGYVDAAWSKTIIEKHSMTGDFILPLVIDAGDYIDIDSELDWKRAERMLSAGDIKLSNLGFQIPE